jgi:tRNA A37 threonylcarbamoyltransferase TsaD
VLLIPRVSRVGWLGLDHCGVYVTWTVGLTCNAASCNSRRCNTLPPSPSPTCTEAGLPPITCLVVSGGVAANSSVRASLTKLAAQYKLPFLAPPPKFCSDNGLMVAWTGLLRLQQGLSRAPPPSLEQVRL